MWQKNKLKLLSLKEVENEVKKLANKIEIYNQDLPTYGRSIDFGHPHIEIDRNGYHYVVVERGSELYRKTTLDLDELLYWIFETITHEIAFSYELKNRDENMDCRRIAFNKQEELMKSINTNWCNKIQEEHKEILNRYPFVDKS